MSAMLMLLDASVLASEFVMWCVGENVSEFEVALIVACAIAGG